MPSELLLFATGLAVGLMNAVAGGGMLLGFPVLIATGLSPLSANATGFVANLPGQLASAIGYRRFLRQVPKYYALLLIPCAAGAALGSYILRRTPGGHFAELVPWLIILAVGLFAFQPWLQAHIHRHITSRVKPLPPFVGFAIILFLLTIYGGYFGPGFGFILLAFLSFTKLKQLHQMNGLKNIAAVVAAAASIAVLSHGSFIDWQAGLTMAAGSIIGGYGGARLVQKVPSHLSRFIVIAIGIAAAAYIGLHHY